MNPSLRSLHVSIGVILLLFSISPLRCEESREFDKLSEAENLVIFLSSPRSGSNLITCSLQAIVRKPIGNFNTQGIHKNGSKRLELDWVSHVPFLYRVHSAEKIRELPSDVNKLIFVTRNPKELFFRQHSISSLKDLKTEKINHKLNQYLSRFKFYESWDPYNRCMVFYEDFINQENEEILLELLDFMGEEPKFFDDYVKNKEKYLNVILSSYRDQHGNKAGKSSLHGSQAIYYTKNKDPELLKHIDRVLQEKAPVIWEKYLKRFETH